MTTPQVTIESLISKWREIADQSSVHTTADEIESFFNEASEAKIAPQDILRYKERILKIWVDFTWSEAQQKHPTWKEKSWWVGRKAKVIKIFGDNYKEFQANTKTEHKGKTEKSEKDYFSHMPVFTNVEDLMKWKARRSAGE